MNTLPPTDEELAVLMGLHEENLENDLGTQFSRCSGNHDTSDNFSRDWSRSDED